MRKLTRSASALGLVAAMAFGLLTIGTPSSLAMPKGGNGNGNGNGGGGGPPAGCPCEEAIEIAPGLFCTLDFCAELAPDAWECGYSCPFPF